MSILNDVNVCGAEQLLTKLAKDGGDLSREASDVIMSMLDAAAKHDRKQATRVALRMLQQEVSDVLGGWQEVDAGLMQRVSTMLESLDDMIFAPKDAAPVDGEPIQLAA